VKIVLDGAQAQIDFAAAHARTREAIESGLPSLAAALHGAGLTLAGGGVYEQHPGRDGEPSPGEGGRGGGSRAAADDEAPAAAAPRRAAVHGLLDAYA
jgi:flagellar hook-length control protein FliK